MGLLSGSKPKKMGFANGAFARDVHGGAWKPNWVSSTIEKADAHYAAPLSFTGKSDAAWDKLAEIAKSTARAMIVEQSKTYLHVEFSSKTLGFTDDAEFALDAAAKTIHVRCGARLGIRDFGANRKYIEAVRAKFSA